MMRYRVEAWLLAGLLRVLRMLPLDCASALGAWLGVRIGPLLSADKVARKNLARVFPEKSDAERDAIRRGMWAHLGGVALEFPFLAGNDLFSRVTFRGLEHLPPPGKPVVFVSGHFGNWELTYPMGHQYGVPVTLIYRRANNPYVEALITRVRRVHADDMFQKGQQGARQMARVIREGKSLAMLIDQKFNQGVAVPFFGREAMTAPTVAQLALRYGMPILPMRVVRDSGAHFTATLYPPLEIARTGDEEADVRAVLAQLHAVLEGWIREYPEQWFWVHRRWPD
jgi:KDO2-lipid IV(A) lauroyltransferase